MQTYKVSKKKEKEVYIMETINSNTIQNMQTVFKNLNADYKFILQGKYPKALFKIPAKDSRWLFVSVANTESKDPLVSDYHFGYLFKTMGGDSIGYDYGTKNFNEDEVKKYIGFDNERFVKLLKDKETILDPTMLDDEYDNPESYNKAVDNFLKEPDIQIIKVN